MNEFEWLRQLRDLRQPLAPTRDLWASIDAALDDARPAAAVIPLPASRSSRHRTWLLAASVAGVALLAGGIGLHRHATLTPTSGSATLATAVPWKPSDPRLGGAAIELDAAHMELQQAMQQSPDSPALQRLLARTERQQAQLRQLAHQAG